MVDAMIVGGDDEPFQWANVDAEICVLPKLDEEGE